MHLRNLLLVTLIAGSMAVSFATGCGRAPVQPPKLDDSTKAAIKAEDKAVFDQERAQK
ncbi:MAG: hypothetical protein ABFD16_12585 [Thermoguttaceae bacterium]